jgi:hypothetical protein
MQLLDGMHDIPKNRSESAALVGVAWIVHLDPFQDSTRAVVGTSSELW